MCVKERKRKMSTYLSPNWPKKNVPITSPMRFSANVFVWYISLLHTQSSWDTIVCSYQVLSNSRTLHSIESKRKEAKKTYENENGGEKEKKSKKEKVVAQLPSHPEWRVNKNKNVTKKKLIFSCRKVSGHNGTNKRMPKRRSQRTNEGMNYMQNEPINKRRSMKSDNKKLPFFCYRYAMCDENLSCRQCNFARARSHQIRYFDIDRKFYLFLLSQSIWFRWTNSSNSISDGCDSIVSLLERLDCAFCM